MLSIVFCVICIHIWSLNPADSHTLRTLYSQYSSILRLRFTANYVISLIDEKTMDPGKVFEIIFYSLKNRYIYIYVYVCKEKIFEHAFTIVIL